MGGSALLLTTLFFAAVSQVAPAVRSSDPLYQTLEELDKAREYYLRQVEQNPLDAESFYRLGALDWLIVHDEKSPKTVEQQEVLIAEGLLHLDIALAINPNFDDAMMYRNLLLREKARLAADGEERTRLVAEADTWFNKALETRKRNRQFDARARSNSAIPAPPFVPPADAWVRVSESAMQRQLIFRPEVVYPNAALQAQIQGVVLVEAFISDHGDVEQVHTITGHPLLVEAALESVKNSRYQPLRLNGQPVKVLTTVTITFKR
jgi:TonB family protein